jgi:hypothetical protein
MPLPLPSLLHSTLLQPPSFVTTAAEDEAKAAERCARIKATRQADEQQLKEQRWLFTGPRAAPKAAAGAAPSQAAAAAQARSSSSGSDGDTKARGSSSANGTGVSKARNSSSCGSWSEGEGGDEGSGGLALQRPPKPMRPAAPPAFKETAAAQLRAQATKQALLEGKYDSREER